MVLTIARTIRIRRQKAVGHLSHTLWRWKAQGQGINRTWWTDQVYSSLNLLATSHAPVSCGCLQQRTELSRLVGYMHCTVALLKVSPQRSAGYQNAAAAWLHVLSKRKLNMAHEFVLFVRFENVTRFQLIRNEFLNYLRCKPSCIGSLWNKPPNPHLPW
jgi:hypothetical protein